MRLRVVLDRSSALFVDRSGQSLGCGGDSLLLSADVRFESTGGTLADEQRTTVEYRERSGLASFGFKSEHGQLSGDLMIGSADDRILLEYSTSGPNLLCAGNVKLSLLSSNSLDYFGDFVWSKPGCRSGLSPITLDATSARDVEVLRAIERAFGDASYVVQWDDGTRPNLSVGLQGSFESACEERSGQRTTLEVPVTLSYGSDDERIVAHTSDARVDVQLGVDGDVQRLQLELSETVACASVDSKIPFGGDTCADLSSVLGLLSLRETADGAGEPTGWFALYQFARTDPHGHAVGRPRFSIQGRTP